LSTNFANGVTVEIVTVMNGSTLRLGAERCRSERGAALAEFALVLPLLAILVFGTIDAGRVFRLNTRLENAAREGAAGIAAFSPFRVDSGCRGRANVVDRVKDEDSGLATEPGFAVKVYKRDSGTGALVPNGGITGCDAASPGVTVAPGDRIVVQVEASFDALSPITGRGRITVHGSHEVVVQG
jgi:Flp pilus assembly pilin Flp